MKKLITLALIFVILSVSLASCGPKESIKTNPHDFHMPDSYEFRYTVVSYDLEGEKTTVTKTAGCDTNGNFLYVSDDFKALYIAKGEDSYEGYYDENVGTYELKYENAKWIDALSSCSGYASYAYGEVKDGAIYEKIESLTLPEDLSGQRLIFLDPERFDYYLVSGGHWREGQVFETAVEKETGICYYAYYPDEAAALGVFYFYVSEYQIPYTGSYGSLRP